MSNLVKSSALAALQSAALPAEQAKPMRRQAGTEPEPEVGSQGASALRGLLHPTERSRYLKAVHLEKARMRASD